MNGWNKALGPVIIVVVNAFCWNETVAFKPCFLLYEQNVYTLDTYGLISATTYHQTKIFIVYDVLLFVFLQILVQNLKQVPRVFPRTVHILRSALSWDITQHSVVVVYWRFRTTYRYYIQGLTILTLEDGTDMLSRNVGTELPLVAA
jgi:hypothetical protein